MGKSQPKSMARGRKTKDIPKGYKKNTPKKPTGVARPGNNPMGNPRVTKDRPLSVQKNRAASAGKAPGRGVSKLPRGGAVGPFTASQAAARKKAMMKRRGR